MSVVMHEIKKHLLAICLVLVSASAVAAVQQVTQNLSRDALLETETGRTYQRLNKKLKDLLADYEIVKSETAKDSLRRDARQIKQSQEYQDAVSKLKSALNKKVTCYGSMCNSKTWPQQAAEQLLRNPNNTNCFYGNDGEVRCKPNAPAPAELYGALPQQTPGDGSEPPPQSKENWMSLNCPRPAYYEDESRVGGRQPYWGCILDMGSCANAQCVVCKTAKVGAEKDWDTVSANLCPHTNPNP